MKKNEVWIVQLEAVTNRYCKDKFSDSELWELSDALIDWHKAAMLNEKVKDKNVHEWFGTILGMLDKHRCKKVRRAMEHILVIMFCHMKLEFEEYVNRMLDEMEANNDKN